MPKRMRLNKRIVILAMRNTMASTITGPMDVFSQAGVMWNHFNKKQIKPCFDVSLVSSNGKPFKCLNGLRMVPDGSIHDIQGSDLILVSSIMDIEKTIEQQSEVISWIKMQYEMGVSVGSICSGAFVLAETGLLDGKTATTHWALANDFKKRYPKIRLMQENLITDHGDIFCAGGFNAGIDLSLYLVNKYQGHELAIETSKTIVHDVNRFSQLPYFIFQFPKNHQDKKIIAIQDWIEENYSKKFNYNDLAQKFIISRRTLERRFKNATGYTPLNYLQHVRVEISKKLLEKKDLSFEEITYQVGYEDSSTFRKIFFKLTGFRPVDYQKKHSLNNNLF